LNCALYNTVFKFIKFYLNTWVKKKILWYILILSAFYGVYYYVYYYVLLFIIVTSRA